jgi:3-hydroxyacyl-[acyl-carrier-protein] dehydratase
MTTPATETAAMPETEGLPSLDITEIMALLPHRYPFLMVDRVLDMRAGQSATGIKNVSINEPFFEGHFPGHPVMPGVLIVEAMAQTAGTLVMWSLGAGRSDEVVYFMTIDKARFRRPVLPGDTLRISVNVQRSRGPVWRFSGEARVDGDLVAEAEFSAMIRRPADNASDASE